MIASALALSVAIGVALVAGDALGDWIGRRIFGQTREIEHAQQPVNNRIEPTVRPANQIPRPPSAGVDNTD